MNSLFGLDEMLKSVASRIVCDVTGSSVISTSPVFKGVMTYKFEVEVDDGHFYIIRFYPKSRGDIIRFEPDLIRRFRLLGLPVPEVIADSRLGPKAELEYMVYKMVDGVALSERISSISKVELKELSKQLVNVLLAVNSCEVSGWGALTNAYQAKCDSWIGFMQDSFKGGMHTVKRMGLLDGAVTDQLECLYANLESFSPSDFGGFAWGDIALANIIVDKTNRLTALIDFEGVLAIEPLLNVGYCFAAYKGTAFFDSFLESWPNSNSEEERKLIELYAVLRALRILRYADESLPCGAARTPVDKLLPGFLPALSNLNDRNGQ